jgi:hypothetical protein
MFDDKNIFMRGERLPPVLLAFIQTLQKFCHVLFFIFTAVKIHNSRYSGISRYHEKAAFFHSLPVFRVLLDNPKRGQGETRKHRTKEKLRRFRPQPNTPPVPGLRSPGAFKTQFL